MELEHRSPKSRYLRTSRKNFEKQLGDIERRQARIRRIRQRLNENGKKREVLPEAKRPESSASSYHIGKTQNYPTHLATIAAEAGAKPSSKVSYLHPSYSQLPLSHVDYRILPKS